MAKQRAANPIKYETQQMSIPRNREMMQVAYYFGRYDASRDTHESTVPPELAALGFSIRRDALEAFRSRIGDGRSASQFLGSISGDIRYIANTIREGGQLRKDRIAGIGRIYGASNRVIWSVVRDYIAPSLGAHISDGAHRQRVLASLNGLDDSKATSDAPFIPTDEDEREFVERQIAIRRGQQRFRDDLRRRYGDRCLVTGCEVLAVLEAAHIRPYRGSKDDDPHNGLLLRSDIHVLFDLNRIRIHPVTLRIEIHPSLKVDPQYSTLAGKRLLCKGNVRPSKVALEGRYAMFRG